MKSCNSFFKEEDIEIKRNTLIELLSKIISFQITENKEAQEYKPTGSIIKLYRSWLILFSVGVRR